MFGTGCPETFGPVYLDETVSKLEDIISKRQGKTSGILSIQSRMCELGLLQRRGKDDVNRPAFTLTKKGERISSRRKHSKKIYQAFTLTERGKRISRRLTAGKEKKQPIECVLSFMNDDGIRQKVPIRGGDVGYLGINTFHSDDC